MMMANKMQIMMQTVKMSYLRQQLQLKMKLMRMTLMHIQSLTLNKLSLLIYIPASYSKGLQPL